MELVDTNVLAYLLIEGVRNTDAALLLKRDPDWHSEAFISVEFTNVLATCLRNQTLTMEQAEDALNLADSIFGKNLHLMDNRTVLRIAHEYKVSAYDARYLAAAESLGVKLVTEDARLRKAAPKLTQSLDEALRK